MGENTSPRCIIIRKVICLPVLTFLLTQTACNTGIRDTQVYHTDLELDFQTNRSGARSGESLQVRFGAKNIGSQSIVIESKDRPVLDIQVYDPASQKVLFSWATQNPGKGQNRIEWKPGESKVIEFAWIVPRVDYRRIVHIEGQLTENSNIAKSAGGLFCLGGSSIESCLY